jgi:hypothetical protein
VGDQGWVLQASAEFSAWASSATISLATELLLPIIYFAGAGLNGLGWLRSGLFRDDFGWGRILLTASLLNANSRPETWVLETRGIVVEAASIAYQLFTECTEVSAWSSLALLAYVWICCWVISLAVFLVMKISQQKLDSFSTSGRVTVYLGTCSGFVLAVIGMPFLLSQFPVAVSVVAALLGVPLMVLLFVAGREAPLLVNNNRGAMSFYDNTHAGQNITRLRRLLGVGKIVLVYILAMCDRDDVHILNTNSDIFAGLGLFPIFVLYELLEFTLDLHVSFDDKYGSYNSALKYIDSSIVLPLAAARLVLSLLCGGFFLAGMTYAQNWGYETLLTLWILWLVIPPLRLVGVYVLAYRRQDTPTLSPNGYFSFKGSEDPTVTAIQYNSDPYQPPSAPGSSELQLLPSAEDDMLVKSESHYSSKAKSWLSDDSKHSSRKVPPPLPPRNFGNIQ